MRISEITPGIPRNMETRILTQLIARAQPVNAPVRLMAMSETTPPIAETANFFINPGERSAAIIIPKATQQTAIIM